MDVVDETPLWNIVSADGFASVSGYLGMNAVLLAGAAVWVHSRETGTGGLRVSTQFFYVENAALASYQTSAALIASANSYGSINSSEVYLQPGAGNGTTGSSGAPSTGSGTSGSNGSSGGGSSTGSDTGGGGTGSVTPSVPKLTINRSGSGTSNVTANGEGVSSGAEIAANTEVTVSVTPAEGATPTASLNGNTVTLTESDGVYSGTFTMPSSNATLVINSGGTTGGSGDMN
jgi:hypothetical protein